MIWILFTSCLFADTPPTEEKNPPVDVAKISEAFGHLIGKNIETMGFKFDIAQVIKGLQDAAAGKNAPMTEIECVQAMSDLQEALFKTEAKENLQKAEEFLEKNKETSSVVSLENNRLQYRIEKEGTGAVVEEHFSPLLRYSAKLLDGKLFDSPKEDAMICLDETMEGFTKGLIGMKEGEKRTLFIHPDLAYGITGWLPPNSLITYEVEVIKANVPPQEPEDALSSVHPKTNPEIATPLDEQKALR